MDKKNEGSDLGNAVSLGAYLVVGALLGLGVGTWLGKRYGWGSNGQLIGLLVGTAAGLYLVIKEAIKANRN